MARIAAVEEPYDDEVGALLESMMPPGVPPIGLFRTFARNRPMASAMRGWGSYELNKQLSVDMRTREIVIDRTCARCGCEYEWGVHVAFFADRVQLTAEQLESLAHGDATDPCWNHHDRLVVRLVDELHDTATVGDALWAQLESVFAPEQLLDLCLLVGWYHAISFVANAAAIDPEPFGASL